MLNLVVRIITGRLWKVNISTCLSSTTLTLHFHFSSPTVQILTQKTISIYRVVATNRWPLFPCFYVLQSGFNHYKGYIKFSVQKVTIIQIFLWSAFPSSLIIPHLLPLLRSMEWNVRGVTDIKLSLIRHVHNEFHCFLLLSFLPVQYFLIVYLYSN